MGSVAYRTLERFLNFFVRYSLDIQSLSGGSPYFLTVKLGKSNPQELRTEIVSFCERELTEYDLVSSDEAPKLQKYDEFIPNNLLRKAFAFEHLAREELREILNTW
jgi:ATP-dependent Lhr-like helicase